MLRIEADHAIERAETAERKNKTLEQHLLQKEQEVQALTHRNNVLETTLEKTTNSLKGTEMKCVPRLNFHYPTPGARALRKSN